jgi:hypothetical protein
MLPAMYGLLMELVEIVKHCDAIDSSCEIGGIIELLSSTSPPDFPFWNDQMLNCIGKPSTPPTVGVFAEKPNYDWVPEIYFYSLDILKQEYPEIRMSPPINQDQRPFCATAKPGRNYRRSTLELSLSSGLIISMPKRGRPIEISFC